MEHTGRMALLSSLGTVSKIVLLILFLFSVISWAIIIYKWRMFRASEHEDRQFLGAYKLSHDTEELRRHARRLTASPVAVVFLGIHDRLAPERDAFSREQFSASALDATSEMSGIDRQYLERVAGLTVQDQISRQETYLPFLATTGNITPFIGLFGTVMGIISAFQDIARQGTASIAAVAPGVAEALVATAAGLFTAIPAVIAYNYYLTRIRQTAFRAEAFTVELLNALHARLKQVGVRG
jgi:biopolymer transport protein TolQ